jgi:hypothetical protein
MKESEKEEWQDWMNDIRSRHPFAKMSKEEILIILRKTREEVSTERMQVSLDTND